MNRRTFLRAAIGTVAGSVSAVADQRAGFPILGNLLAKFTETTYGVEPWIAKEMAYRAINENSNGAFSFYAIGGTVGGYVLGATGPK